MIAEQREPTREAADRQSAEGHARTGERPAAASHAADPGSPATPAERDAVPGERQDVGVTPGAQFSTPAAVTGSTVQRGSGQAVAAAVPGAHFSAAAPQFGSVPGAAAGGGVTVPGAPFSSLPAPSGVPTTAAGSTAVPPLWLPAAGPSPTAGAAG